jgi:peptidoglycan hydrolase-like protein with peptidoglycan-binding domain
VRSLQSQLNLCYGPGSSFPGHVAVFKPALGLDGDFGAKTAAALRAVQAHHHIGADGMYGPQTRPTINFFADDAGGVERCVRFGA